MKKITVQEKRGKCFICGKTCTEEHHIFFGSANRKISDELGLVCDLCPSHHRLGIYSVHRNAEMNKALQAYGQACFEMVYSKDEFMKLFGKNYIDDENYRKNPFYLREVEAKFYNEEDAEDIMDEEDVEPVVNKRCGLAGESKCPICKKLFYPTPEWAYKNPRGKNVCSYHCMRDSERQKIFNQVRKYEKRDEVVRKEFERLEKGI